MTCGVVHAHACVCAVRVGVNCRRIFLGNGFFIGMLALVFALLGADEQERLARLLADQSAYAALAEVWAELPSAVVDSLKPRLVEACVAAKRSDDVITVCIKDAAVVGAVVTQLAAAYILPWLVEEAREDAWVGAHLPADSEHASAGEDGVDAADVVDAVRVLERFATAHTHFLGHVCRLLALLLCSLHQPVAAAAASALRWAIPTGSSLSGEFVWELTQHLLASTVLRSATHGYVLWMRFLAEDTTPAHFQTLFSTPHYWESIQLGLYSTSPEHRKYALTILQRLLQRPHAPITTLLVQIDPSDPATLAPWQRFCALYEVVAVDTLLHQLQAALAEIIEMVSLPRLVVPNLWGVVLLTTAITATMESVRKFGLALLMALPLERLGCFSGSLTSLLLFRTTIIPFIATASHFKAVRDVDLGAVSCPYGMHVLRFVEHVVLCSLDVEQSLDAVLLALVAQRSAFDHARTFMLMGVLRGLEAVCGEVRVVQLRHTDQLLHLSEVAAELEVCEQLVQTVLVRLLCVDRHVEPARVWSSVSRFILLNNNKDGDAGYRVVRRCVDLFQPFVTDNEPEQTEAAVVWSAASNTTSRLPVVQVVMEAHGFSSGSAVLTHVVRPIAEDPMRAENMLLLVATVVRSTPVVRDISAAGIARVVTRVEELVAEALGSATPRLETAVLLVQLLALCRASPALGDLQRLYQHAVLPLMRASGSRFTSRLYVFKDQLCEAFLGLASHAPVVEACEWAEAIAEGVGHFRSRLAAVGVWRRALDSDVSLSWCATIHHQLVSIWRELCLDRLVLVERELHLAVVDCMFHPRLLEWQANEASNGNEYLWFVLLVVEQSFSRRSFLPLVTRRLREFAVSNAGAFQKTPWVGEALVEAYILRQLETNMFRLEPAMGRLYDELVGGGDLYTQVHGDEEAATFVNVLAILAEVACLSTVACSVVKGCVDRQLLKPSEKAPREEEWRRGRLYQLVLAASEPCEDSEPLGIPIAELVRVLGVERSPMVRTYTEWLVALRLVREMKGPELGTTARHLFAECLLEELLPLVLTLYMRVLYLAGVLLGKPQELVFMERFVREVVIPLSASNKAMVRHFAATLVVLAYPEITSKLLEVSSVLVELVERIYTATVHLETFGLFRCGDQLLWDIQKLFSFAGIAGGVVRQVCEGEYESVAVCTIEKYASGVSLMEIGTVVVPPPVVSVRAPGPAARLPASEAVRLALESSANGQSPLQTKSGAWSAGVEDTGTTMPISRTPLIVLALLVDKPPNLGGICRLLDVLGAGTLALNDLRVARHPQFKTVAVTAEQWMPMVEVPVASIAEYMRARKREGYTLIGLEQTDQLQVLSPATTFPRKLVILLGREREGIPGDLLAELDFCVEIRQAGVIRLMNIQTATAVIVHAYAEQHVSI